MTRCEECGKYIDKLPYECNWCGNKFCSKCRLPEKHTCGGTYSDTGSDTVVVPGEKAGPLSYLIGAIYLLVWALKIPIRMLVRVLSYPIKRPYTFAYYLLIVCAAGAVLLIGVGLYGGVGIAPIDDAADQASGGVGSAVDTLGEATERPSEAEIEDAIHREVNTVRSEHGLQTIQHSPELREVARQHSEHMASEDYFHHDSPEGVGPQQRVNRAGISCRVGENLHYEEGFSTSDVDIVAERVVDSWMNSPGHRENVLRSGWHSEGIGVERSGSELYVTQKFCA